MGKNRKFDLIESLGRKEKHGLNAENEQDHFQEICRIVKAELDQMEEMERQDPGVILERQKNAILGHAQETAYYKSKIADIIRKLGHGGEWYPGWYMDLADAIYHETMGYAGLAVWIEARTPELQRSSSAKIIGERVYFMMNGHLVLQPQTFSEERRLQLHNALLLATPEKRRKDTYHEVYLSDGTRVTMYNEGMAKKGQSSIVFRKFFVNDYTFEKQAELHTIPAEAIPLFSAMVRVGYNVAFIGPVRSAKTTFLTTWQAHEDPSLEGVMVESDPEIPLHQIMPDAPIMQFVPQDDEFPLAIKRIMRSDADYIIMAEARDGVALNTAVQAANKGTRRVKMTFHTTDAMDFCFDVANEIIKVYGGDLGSCITKVAKSFHFIFQFYQLQDKSQKRLKAIWEIQYSPSDRTVRMNQICQYNQQYDDWAWSAEMAIDKYEIGKEENAQALADMQLCLKKLADEKPIEGDHIFTPFYSKLIGGAK